MTLRPARPSDIEDLIRLNTLQDFRLRDRSACVCDAVVEKNGKVVAYGIVKGLAEAIVLVDTEVPRVSRMKAIMELMKEAIFKTQKKGIPQLHCFVSNKEVARLLVDKYGFMEVKDIVLVRNL